MSLCKFKPRKKTCKGCQGQFIPSRPMQPACSPKCDSATAKPRPARKPMKSTRVRQTALTKAARGRDCQVRIPGICNGNSETVVLAHYRMAGVCGAGMKPIDVLGAWACHACHDVIDGRVRVAADRDILRLWHAEGVMRTLDILVKEGAVKA